MVQRHDLPPRWSQPDGEVPPLPTGPTYKSIGDLGTGVLGEPRTPHEVETYRVRDRSAEIADYVTQRPVESTPTRRRTVMEWMGDNKFVTGAIALGTTALTAVAAYATLSRGPSASESSVGSTEPVATSTANPGASETTSVTPEAMTAETAEFHIGGKTIVGVEALYAELVVPQEIVAKRPRPTVEGETATWNEYLNSLQEATNIEASAEAGPFLKEATKKALFSNPNASALAKFIDDLQRDGSKIVSIDNSLIFKPLDVQYIHGKATIIYERDGKIMKKYMTAALGNNSGIAQQWDKVSIVSDEPII